jgi:hypothetical protein
MIDVQGTERLRYNLDTILSLCLRKDMPKASFVIYGCPYTAFESTKDIDAFVVPEPDRTLYHLTRNTNRILNLVGFSGVKDIRLVGCSQEFVEDFSALLAEHPEAGFSLSIEANTCTTFSERIVGDADGADVIVVEDQPNLIPIGFSTLSTLWPSKKEAGY